MDFISHSLSLSLSFTCSLVKLRNLFDLFCLELILLLMFCLDENTLMHIWISSLLLWYAIDLDECLFDFHAYHCLCLNVSYYWGYYATSIDDL